MTAVFPALPGLDWTVTKTPIWKTDVKTTASGRELRTGYWSYPKWKFKLGYEFLRADANQELQTLVGFFMKQQGQQTPFLYSDPTDNSVSNSVFGTGDGLTTAFQLSRILGGFAEPVFYLNGTPSIYVNGALLQNTPRTNLQIDSQNFSPWTQQGATVAASAGVAPDGSNTATKLIPTTASSSNHHVGLITAITSGQTYTISCFAKAAEYSDFYLNSNLNGQWETTHFNLSTGMVGLVGSGMTATITALSNGWYRCAISAKATGSSVQVNIGGGSSSWSAANGGSPYYPAAGDGTSGIYIWGAQLETGSSPTGYIPTTSSPVTVTVYSINNGLVTFYDAPASGASLTWSGAFYFLCRFLADSQDFENFMYQLWQLKQVEIQTVKS